MSSLWSAHVAASPTELEFSAPPSCPSQEWFTTELAQQGVPEPHRGEFEVRVERARNAEGYAAVAKAHDASSWSPSWQRELEGSDCAQLLSALAVSFAVHLEGEAAKETPKDAVNDSTADPVEHADPAPALAREPQSTRRLPAAQSTANPLQDSAISSMRQKLVPELERNWRWGLGLGGAVRTGVDPQLSVMPSMSMVFRARESGWGSGPFSLGVVFAPSSDTAMPGEVDGETSWSHGWWAVGVTLTPGTFTLIDKVRVGPAVAFHAGNYSASLPGNASRSRPIMFSDLRLHADRQFDEWLLDGHVGLHLPVSPLSINTSNQVLHQQEPGLVVGLAANWMGVIL